MGQSDAAVAGRCAFAEIVQSEFVTSAEIFHDRQEWNVACGVIELSVHRLCLVVYHVYTGCVQILCVCVFPLQDGATWASAQSMATRVFWDAAAAAQLIPQHSSTQELPQQRPQLQLQLFSWDGGPRPMPSGADLQQHNHKFKTLRVTVSNIQSRSPAHPGLLLGSVLYMDSFADVSV